MVEWLNVSETTPRIAYTATASQTVFVVPFVFFEDEDIVVYQNNEILTLTIDYTVAGAEVEAGGTVTLLTGATAGDVIVIVRDVAIVKTTHIPPSGPLDIPAVNIQLSKLIAIDQQLQDTFDRSILIAPSDATPITTLPPAADRALKNLSFDALGNPSVTATVDGTTISSVMIPVATASTLAIARDEMGVASFATHPSGLVGDGVTDNLAALQAYRDAVIADGSMTMLMPEGTYVISNKLELGYAGLKVVALGKVTFKHTGTGAAISFDAGAAPSTATIFDIEFGWGNDIFVTGNINTTDLIFIRSCHHMKIGANVRDGRTGMGINFTVLSQIRLTCSGNQGGFTVTPDNALVTSIRNAGETVTDSVFYVIAEAVDGTGVELNYCNGCEFAGTSEGNGGGGVHVTTTSARNTFTGFDCEVNSLVTPNQQDWNIEGEGNLFINCVGALTTSNLQNIVSGARNVFIGGHFENMTVHAIASYTIMKSVMLKGTATLNSATATYESCYNEAGLRRGAEWTAFTPTITAGAGTFTTVSAEGRYQWHNNTIRGTMSIFCTTVGTASLDVRATLPYSFLKHSTACVGTEISVTGKAVTGYGLADTTFFMIRYYDGTFPGGTGNRIELTFEYEIV